MTYILITDNNIEPLLINEVKTHLRVDGDDYDNLIIPIIKKVKQFAELITGRDLLNKTYKLYLDYFCDPIEIRKSKLQSITSIKYYNNGVLTTLDPSYYYFTNENNYSFICLNNNKYYPSTDLRRQAVEIIFVAGYGTSADNIPSGLKYAMLQHCTYLFENAGDCNDGNFLSDLYKQYIIATNLVRIL